MPRLPASDAQHSPFPRRIGRYELLVPLASGGMATVFLARQYGPGGFEREVALKLVHPHLRGSPEWLTELFEEAKLAGRVGHPNVVPLLDVGDDPAGAYLALEYVEGDSLAGLISAAARDREPLPLALGMRILCDALAGLHAAHELCDDRGAPVGLVHRDFSPHNLLVGTDGVTRLTDFGIAKAASRTTSTRTGLIKGKVAYMAPEQARGQPLDRRCDVWAAGVIAWELAAGRPLYQEQEDLAIGLRLVSERPPRLRTVVSEAPAALDEAIAAALAPEPDRRCSTADELRRRLSEAVPPAPHQAVADWVRERAAPLIEQRRLRAAEARRAQPLAVVRRRRWPLAVGAAGLAGVLALVAWRALAPACGADLENSGEHCGACGHSCLGGTCVAGQCHPLLIASQQPGAYGIAVDETSVYWTNVGRGTVHRIAKSGDPRSLRRLVEGRVEPRFLVVDDRAVYVTVMEAGEVIRVGKEGGPESARVLASGQGRPYELAVDATHVYFGTQADGALKRVPKEGGAVEIVGAGSNPGGIAVDGRAVYWLDREGATAGSLKRWAKAASLGEITTVAAGQARPAAIAVDETHVYWTNFNGGTVNKLPKDAPTGSTPVELARGQRAPTGLTAADPDWIYFTAFGGHTIHRVRRDGGGLATLPSGTTRGPVRIAVDAVSLYWTSSESAAVFRLAR